LSSTCPRVPVIGPVMSHRLRLALEMLADAGAHGTTEFSFVSRFTPELLDLVRDGLATAEREVLRKGRRVIEIVRVRITDEGRRALEGQAGLIRH